jgi:hypothetical protein
MASTFPNPDVLSNGAHPHAPSAEFPDRGRSQFTANDDGWGADNQSVNLGGNPADDANDLIQSLGIADDAEPGLFGKPDFAQMRRENIELREIIAELKQQLDQPRAAEGDSQSDKQKEFESILEEKTEIIRSLHKKIQELQAHRPATTGSQKEDELLALSEELDRERCQLQQDRKQLEDERQQLMDDEELMTKQMRDMEVQMARERADFARQRSELTRIYEEIRREMENIERNGLLNQRLGQLRQRLHETGAAVGAPLRAGSNPTAPVAKPAAADPSSNSAAGRQGILGRIFG